MRARMRVSFLLCSHLIIHREDDSPSRRTATAQVLRASSETVAVLTDRVSRLGLPGDLGILGGHGVYRSC